MNDDELSEAIFGSFDGVVSVIGVIVALLAAPKQNIVAAAVGLAVASAVGMAAGEYLGDASRNLRRALVMGLATIVGTMLPVIPFFFLAKPLALGVSAVTCVLLTLIIGYFRARRTSPRAYVETLAILLLAAAVTALISLGTGMGA